jgi:hypothetical protein
MGITIEHAIRIYFETVADTQVFARLLKKLCSSPASVGMSTADFDGDDVKLMTAICYQIKTGSFFELNSEDEGIRLAGIIQRVKTKKPPVGFTKKDLNPAEWEIVNDFYSKIMQNEEE